MNPFLDHKVDHLTDNSFINIAIFKRSHHRYINSFWLEHKNSSIKDFALHMQINFSSFVIPVLVRRSASARRRENGNPGFQKHGFLLPQE
jgi:hypothetical protein